MRAVDHQTSDVHWLQIPLNWTFAAKISQLRDANVCQSSQACLVNLRCISTVFVGSQIALHFLGICCTPIAPVSGSLHRVWLLRTGSGRRLLVA